MAEKRTICRARPGTTQRSDPVAWWDLSPYPFSHMINVDDVRLVQPVGFVWFAKPRYRVKAVGRKVAGKTNAPINGGNAG